MIRTLRHQNIGSRIFVAGLILAGSALSALGQGITKQSPPPNKKFVVEIVEEDVDIPVVRVFKFNGGLRTFFWQQPLMDQAEADLAQSVDYEECASAISSDGESVLLHEHNVGSPVFVRVVRRDGANKGFHLDDFHESLPGWKEHELRETKAGEHLVVNLIDQKPPSYAVWESTAGKWAELNLQTLQISSPGADREKTLNQLGLRQAREEIRRYQPEFLSKAITSFRQPLRRLVPALVSEEEDAAIFFPTSAYQFIAHQKQPQDRRLINRLLEAAPSPDYFEGFRILGVGSIERMRGDELMARWEGNTSRAFSYSAPGGLAANEKHYSLARVQGVLRLPFQPPDNGGLVRIFLIPDDLKKEGWDKNDRVWETSRKVASSLYHFGSENRSEFSFGFSTISPGKYRLKAVWDKRPPHAGRADSKAEITTPGDYESNETETFLLEPGDIRRGFILECTNQVGQAAEYFAADEVWKLENPAIYETNRFELGMRSLFEGAVSDLILKTNKTRSGFRLKWMQYTELDSWTTPTRSLSLSFGVPRVTEEGGEGSEVDYRVVLVDQHGCKFHGDTFPGSRHRVATFEMVPMSEDQFTVEIHSEEIQEPQETIVASFVMRNPLKGSPRNLEARETPVTAEADSLQIFLNKVEIGATDLFYWLSSSEIYGVPRVPINAADHSFSFKINGKPDTSWRKRSGAFIDRWGQPAGSVNDFCTEETEFTYRAAFIRDPATGEFGAEEKFVVPLETVPGLAESIPLNKAVILQNQRFRFLSVGGPGEFVYQDGQLVSSTNLPPRSTAYSTGHRDFFMKPRSSRSGVSPLMSMTENQTVVTRFPHLVCLRPQLGNSAATMPLEIDLVEKDPSIADANPWSTFTSGCILPSTPWSPFSFFALKLKPGSTNKQITLVVQKPVVAEFAVKIPKGSRAKPGTKEAQISTID